MTEPEWRAFVMDGTRTAKVATARKDGRPHVVPVWFVLDGEDIVFTTGATSVKGAALRRDRYACLCVDDQVPPFSFVMVEGPVELSSDLDELRRIATRLGARPVLINGLPGAVFEAMDGVQTVAFEAGDDGKLSAIYIMRNPDKLGHVRA